MRRKLTRRGRDGREWTDVVEDMIDTECEGRKTKIGCFRGDCSYELRTKTDADVPDQFVCGILILEPGCYFGDEERIFPQLMELDKILTLDTCTCCMNS